MSNTDPPDRAPTVSVVVPTHRRPMLLERAVRGIMAQDHDGDIEVVVVFDNCKPHPVSVDVPPRRTLRTLHNSERTTGLAGARNTGILAATGDWIAFCDDDDEWLRDKLSRQMQVALAADEPILVATGVVVVTDDGDVPRRCPGPILRHADFLRDRIMEVHPSSFLMRRDALVEDVGLVDETLPASYAEDYDLLLRWTRHHDVVTIADPLVRADFHAGSFYATQWQKIADGLEALLDRHPDFSEAPEGLARIEGQLAFCHAALGRRRSARATALRALRRNPREPRAYLAMAVASGAPAPWVSRMLRRRGRGI